MPAASALSTSCIAPRLPECSAVSLGRVSRPCLSAVSLGRVSAVGPRLRAGSVPAPRLALADPECQVEYIPAVSTVQARVLTVDPESGEWRGPGTSDFGLG